VFLSRHWLFCQQFSVLELFLPYSAVPYDYACSALFLIVDDCRKAPFCICFSLLTADTAAKHLHQWAKDFARRERAKKLGHRRPSVHFFLPEIFPYRDDLIEDNGSHDLKARQFPALDSYHHCILPCPEELGICLDTFLIHQN
jgi:hypothetical protein